MLAGKRYMTNLKHSLRSTHVTLTHDCMSCLMTSLFCLVIEVASDLEKSFQWKTWTGILFKNKHGLEL